jgi:hypothetical protein
LAVGVGVDPFELVWVSVDEIPGMTVAESPEVIVEVTAEVEVVAAGAFETPVAVKAALAERAEEEVFSLIPQTASASNVKEEFRRLHSKVSRSMDSRHLT